MSVIDLKNATIELRDGSGKKLAIKIGGGNITYDEKRAIDYIKDRGVLDTVREGEEQPMDVRFDVQWSFLTATGTATIPTAEDALKQRGAAASWVSSAADPCEPYAVDVYIFDIPKCETETPETILLPDFRWESIAHDPKASNLAVSGKSNAKQATVTRGSATT